MSSSTDGESLSLQQRQILDTIDKKQVKVKHQALISTLPRERFACLTLSTNARAFGSLQSHLLFVFFSCKTTSVLMLSWPPIPSVASHGLKLLFLPSWSTELATCNFSSHPLLTANPHNLVPFLEGYLESSTLLSFLGPCVRLMESKLRVATENIVSQVWGFEEGSLNSCQEVSWIFVSTLHTKWRKWWGGARNNKAMQFLEFKKFGDQQE